ncbi:hypothetical protein EI555_000418 [Monodon monoceros]|uniref:Uncharacterized protein n=1 Tax=Monodon monoceros TaxID=40151 RepID=A0A4U1FPZ4_MONMO|nr:hypothetical protein EI555_000418 [Monodon monoceros]
MRRLTAPYDERAPLPLLLLLTGDRRRHRAGSGAASGARRATAAALTLQGIRTSNLYILESKTLYRETQKCTNIAH